MGLFCLWATIGRRPRPWRRVLAALGWSCVVAFTCCPVAGITLWRLHEIVDFAGGPITEGERDLPIETAFIRHGRGVTYGVWLRDYSALLTIDRRDYLNAFGSAQRVRPIGYCLRAVVQHVGKASRILAENGQDLPAGSLERCPGANGASRPAPRAAPRSARDREALYLSPSPVGRLLLAPTR